MCSKSFALGRWRGAMGRPCDVVLAGHIVLTDYAEGHALGREERAERQRNQRGAGRRGIGRR